MAVRVLIVDDHEDVRFLIRAIIEDAAENVVVVGEADGVRAALESIDALDPDVVVLDAVMPVVSGIEAAPMILARRPGQKILLCSALVDDEVREKADQAGITDCVSKDDMEAIPGIAFRLARDSGP
ncbi:MAG TPA: response regulator [Solirubrobacteraceae bacterium]|nr:response regulator [Solirubrobacteraceae bacterium]